MLIEHQGELRPASCLMMRGDGWGRVMLRNKTTLALEWWIARHAEPEDRAVTESKTTPHEVIDFLASFHLPGIANAHVLRASEDLLASLQAINAHWESGNFCRKPELWEPMKAAIAKATNAP